MEFKPYHYQKYAGDFILNHHEACLLLDMGMGKTVITLTAVEELMYNYCSVRKVLIIAPLNPAKETWLVEAAKWDHLKRLTCSLVVGSPKARIEALEKRANIYILNRENVVWLVDYLKQEKKPWDFDMVIIDELSSFKSASAKRFRALKKVRKHITRMVGLTGTPAPNGLLDLWPQMFLMDGGAALGKTITGYRETYFVPDKRNQNTIFSWKPREGAEETIYKQLEPFCVSMQASDFLKLPERLLLNRVVTMSPTALKLYKQMERDTLLPFVNGDIDAPTAATLTGKLLQIASGAAYDENQQVRYLHDDKMIALDTLIEESNGQSVLIFYSFRHEKERIMQRYPQAVDIKQENSITSWNKGEISMLLAHPASAGHGLNLQSGGHIAIWFGLPTSLELYQQANKRLHRPGQKETVLIHHLLMKDTYDERVLSGILAPKEVRQNALFEALTAKLEELKKGNL